MGTCLILHILTQHQRAKRGTSPIALKGNLFVSAKDIFEKNQQNVEWDEEKNIIKITEDKKLPFLSELYTGGDYAHAEDYAKVMFRKMKYYPYFVVTPQYYDAKTDAFHIMFDTFDGKHFVVKIIMGSKKLVGNNYTYQIDITEK